MSHKVHPKIFRVKETNDWLSRGFYEKNFKRLLKEDFVIRSFLDKKLKQTKINNTKIRTAVNEIDIINNVVEKDDNVYIINFNII